MLSPSWPSPASSRRPAIPPRIRKRVRVAERRALRHAVQLAGVVVAVLILVDVAVALAAAQRGVATLVAFEIGAAAIAAAMAVSARRGIARAEVLAMVVLVVTFATALLGVVLMPGGRVLASAQMAVVLVGAGLFLPWSKPWHAAAMSVCALLTVGFVATPVGAAITTVDRANLLTGVVMAAVTSAIGHALWQPRFRAMLEQQFALRSLSRYAQRQEAHVSELNRELSRVARRDALTGIGNRLALDEAIGRLLDPGDRVRPMRFALALFDIDHFKLYNDEHGHLAGDAALGRLGQILRDVTRSEDLAFRYGGEEFLLLAPGVDLNGALAVAERVRIAVSRDREDGFPPFTVSGGVALCDPADGRNPEPLLRRADSALYLAKRAGRDRIAADELSIAMQRQEIAAAG